MRIYAWRKRGRLRRTVLFLAGVFLVICAYPQHVPSSPLSIPVYHPQVLNPAYSGSKDFTNITLTSKVLKSAENQLLHVNHRLVTPNGFFSNVGIGGYAFREQLTSSWNGGIAVAGSYHLALDDEQIHILSGGAALKGILHAPRRGNETVDDSATSMFNPNLDVGVFYYGPTAFAGLSLTSAFGTRLDDDLTTGSEAYIPRMYHLYGGYKFLLSRSNAIVLEPSLLISVTDSSLGKAHRHLTPYLKLYLQNFYIGTYMKTVDIFALFFQYQFPRFHTGIFLEFPRVGFLNDENIIFELSLGVNLGKNNPKFTEHRHW